MRNAFSCLILCVFLFGYNKVYANDVITRDFTQFHNVTSVYPAYDNEKFQFFLSAKLVIPPTEFGYYTLKNVVCRATDAYSPHSPKVVKWMVYARHRGSLDFKLVYTSQKETYITARSVIPDYNNITFYIIIAQSVYRSDRPNTMIKCTICESSDKECNVPL